MNNRIGNTYSYKFLLPGMLVYSIFFIIPTLLSFYFSFTDWNIDGAKLIGMENFKYLISEPELRGAFKNTFIFAFVTTVFKIIFGLLLALLLNMKLKSRVALRTIFYFPAVLSSVAVGLIFSSLYHPTTGLINRMLTGAGLNFLARDWLGDPGIVIYSICFIEIWKWTGFIMIIFLAGLQSIPKEYYEATDIDGASSFQSFRHITFPLLNGPLNSSLLLSIIGGLKVFEIVRVSTNGGPGSASEVLASIIYKNFAFGYFGLATAGGLMLFIVVSCIAVPLNWYVSKREVEV